MTDLPLADLDVFAAVAQHRSFRAAAKLRNVSASSLSDSVRRLEARLGVRLLNRTTRSVTPTDAGERLLQRLRPGLADIAAALDGVNDFRDRPVGRLRLNVPGIVARTILPDIAARFLALHPGITLEVSTNDALIDVIGEGFDAGVRYEESLQPDMIAVPIGPRLQHYVAAAAPGYLAAHGVPAHPQDLLQHRCILHRFSSGRMLAWVFEEKGGRELSILPPARIIAETSDLEVELACRGLGIVFSFEDFLRPALARGDLVSVLQDWSPSFSGPFLYYNSRHHMPSPLRAFVEFLRAEHKRAEAV
ncbi:LysR substrate-binding domain-containing protein [Rhizobium sp. CSW-27]|uniref:LysR substrate-binding domain-containing protein n=1 Tax=Rhizobium sp. CSW-27 TaxID=2839985 RepID=UPI001C02FD8C|nr:LysR substrate-binding domain-containing protein [Rhizobium sp. CSW-27]MBT9372541.1 LysR family transcriptional regulator [Rhizobium sp. CSW-27]